MNGEHRHFLKSYFLIVFFVLGFVATVNWWVDPYNQLGRNNSGIYFSVERQAKKSIMRYEHNALLIGSSIMADVDPDKLCGYNFYNASFRAAVPEEIFFYLDRFMGKERMTVIGLDFYMFNETEFPLITKKQWLSYLYDIPDYLISFRVFKDSLVTGYKRKRGDPVEIFLNGRHNDYIQIERDRHFSSYDFSHSKESLRKGPFYQYHFSQKRLEYLNQIKELLEQKNIEYVILINPINEEILEMLRSMPRTYSILLNWKKMVKEIFPNTMDLSMSEYSLNSNYYKKDATHYKAEVGAMIINKVLGCSSGGR